MLNGRLFSTESISNKLTGTKSGQMLGDPSVKMDKPKDGSDIDIEKIKARNALYNTRLTTRATCKVAKFKASSDLDMEKFKAHNILYNTRLTARANFKAANMAAQSRKYAAHCRLASSIVIPAGGLFLTYLSVRNAEIKLEAAILERDNLQINLLKSYEKEKILNKIQKYAETLINPDRRKEYESCKEEANIAYVNAIAKLSPEKLDKPEHSVLDKMISKFLK